MTLQEALDNFELEYSRLSEDQKNRFEGITNGPGDTIKLTPRLIRDDGWGWTFRAEGELAEAIEGIANHMKENDLDYMDSEGDEGSLQ